MGLESGSLLVEADERDPSLKALLLQKFNGG